MARRMLTAKHGDSYWQIYQACVYPYYPALVSLDEFSVSLFAFLDCSAEARAKTVSTWLGLLFALLACGAQFSDDPVEERELRSKVFGECSEKKRKNDDALLLKRIDLQDIPFSTSLLLVPVPAHI